MTDFRHSEVESALRLINEGIDQLKSAFPFRHFTIDGRLVGDIGEAIAAREFDIILDATPDSSHQKSRPHYDAVTRVGGRNVQIKATFKDSLTFTTTPELYLGLRINADGSHRVIYNGAGQLIFDRYKHRAGIGEKLLSFPVMELASLDAQNTDADRIPLRSSV